LRLHPDAQNHYSLAACLISMGQYAEALSELNVALALKPQESLYRSRKQELLRLMKASSVATREISSVLGNSQTAASPK
jgi:tetratricopeptide (TPR) repeat protein